MITVQSPRTISLSELRPQLTAVLELVKLGQQVIITERGIPVAVLRPPLTFTVSGSFDAPDGPIDSGLAAVQRKDRAEREMLKRINKKS